jgi:hypothetical protein
MALETNLQKLNKLMSLMDSDSLTKEDFLKYFKEVVNFVKKIETHNMAVLDGLEKRVNKELHSVSNQVSVNTSRELNTLKREIADLQRKSSKEQTDGLNFIKDKMARFKADEDKRINKVYTSIDAISAEHKEIIKEIVEIRESLNL